MKLASVHRVHQMQSNGPSFWSLLSFTSSYGSFAVHLRRCKPAYERSAFQKNSIVPKHTPEFVVVGQNKRFLELSQSEQQLGDSQYMSLNKKQIGE